MGLAAIALWSTTIACSRTLTEQVGTFTAAATVYLAAGTIGCVWLVCRRRLTTVLRDNDPRYLVICGGLMVVYTTLLYWAVGMSASREQAIAVTVANYLWPCLTLMLAVPILGWTCRGWLLVSGSAVAIAGVALSMGNGSGAAGSHWTIRELLPVIAAAAAAVAWAAYSNLSRLWGGAGARGAVPVFLLATGIVLASIRLGVREASAWTLPAAVQCAYMAVMPTLLAYAFWDFGARRGNLALIAAASYLTPVFSVWISSACWRLSLTRAQCAASILVVLGAVLCRSAIRSESAGAPQPTSECGDSCRS